MKITLEECERIMERNGGWLDLRGTHARSFQEAE